MFQSEQNNLNRAHFINLKTPIYASSAGEARWNKSRPKGRAVTDLCQPVDPLSFRKIHPKLHPISLSFMIYGKASELWFLWWMDIKSLKSQIWGNIFRNKSSQIAKGPRFDWRVLWSLTHWQWGSDGRTRYSLCLKPRNGILSMGVSLSFMYL